MAELEIDGKLRSLARAVARGRPVASWARKHSVPVDLAEELCTSPQVGRLVDEYRLKATDQITGKLLAQSAEAIDEVFRALTRGRNHAAKFAAVRIILDNALRFWVRFDQTKTMHDLKEKVAAVMQKRSSPGFGGSPYPSGARKDEG